MKKGLFLLGCLFVSLRLLASLTPDQRALFNALNNGGKVAVDRCLDKLTHLDFKNKKGSTPLKNAIGRNNLIKIKLLLNSDLRLAREDYEGLLDFIHEKIKSNKKEGKNISRLLSIRKLLGDDDRFVYTETPEVERPQRVELFLPEQKEFFIELSRGKKAAIEECLGKLRHLDFKNRKGNTPLKSVINKQKPVLVELLLDSNLPVSQDDKDSLLDFLHEKIKSKNKEGKNISELLLIQELLDDDDRFVYTETPEVERPQVERPQQVKSLSPDQKELLIAIESGKKAAIEECLGKLRHLDFKNRKGNTPLKAIISKLRAVWVELLLNSGLRLAQEDCEGLLDFLHEKIKLNKEEGKGIGSLVKIQKLLDDDGRFVYTKTPQVERPQRAKLLSLKQKELFIAITSGKKDAIEGCLGELSHLDFKNQKGNTPLKAIISKLRPVWVELLLNSGLRLAQEDCEGLLDFLHEKIKRKIEEGKGVSSLVKIRESLFADPRFVYTKTPKEERLQRVSAASGGARDDSESKESGLSSLEDSEGLITELGGSSKPTEINEQEDDDSGEESVGSLTGLDLSEYFGAPREGYENDSPRWLLSDDEDDVDSMSEMSEVEDNEDFRSLLLKDVSFEEDSLLSDLNFFNFEQGSENASDLLPGDQGKRARRYR